MLRISGSIVLFNNPLNQFEAAIRAFFESICDATLVVFDNSPVPLKSQWFGDSRVIYVYSGRNVGFGAGHNRAFASISYESDVHLFLNPDVSFQPFVLPALIQDFEDDGLLVALNPRVLYPDGHIQRLAKKIPTPVDLIVRRFIPYGGLRSKFARNYELNELDEWREKIEVPIVSGCFLLVRSKKFKEIGGFDERYFMYMEDFDLVRRLAETGRVLLDARFNIVHGYAKGSYRNPVLLRYHIISAIHYFNKWGWFFDKKRVAGNTRFSSMMKTIRSARV